MVNSRNLRILAINVGLMAFHCAPSFAESSGSSADLTTLVPGKSELPNAIRADQIRAARKEQAETEKAIASGEVAIDLAPEPKVVRYADLFRKKSRGDAQAGGEWDRLKPEDRVLALARVLAFSDKDLRQKALVAISDLSREDDPEGKVLPALVEAAIQDPEKEVREAARKQILAARDDAHIARLLVKDFRKRGPVEQRRAVEALRAMGGPEVQKVVIDHWRDVWGPGPRAHMFVARQQSYIADYEINGDSYDPVVRQFLVGTILDVKPLLTTLDTYIVKILHKITGADKGRDANAWRKWWKEEQQKQDELAKWPEGKDGKKSDQDDVGMEKDR